MAIGMRLNLIRTKKDMTLKEMSKIFGITPATLSRYENGDREPDIEFLSEFGKYFHISGNWLLYGENPIFTDGKQLELDEKEKFLEFFDDLGEPEIEEKEQNLSLMSLDNLSEGTAENYLKLLKNMKKNPVIRKNILQFFFIFQVNNL